MRRVLALPISVAVLLTSCSSTPTDVPSPAYERRPPAPAAASSVNPVVQWNRDRKSTRLNSSHGYISYAVFCLKKKNKKKHTTTRMHPMEHNTAGVQLICR